MLRRLLDSPRPYFVGAGVLLVIAIASQFELQIPSRPKGTVEDIVALSERDDLNVIFLVVDTLRSDRLGLYGYDRDTSPVLDSLAAHGIVFKHVIAQSSWTKSSMASLWTATNPTRNGVLRYNQTLPEEVDFPAEIFKRAGYRTAGIWRNGWVAPNFGFAQGFDTYVKPVTTPDRRRIQRSNPSARKLKGTDADCTASAVEFLRNFGDERFFLYLHFMDVHQYVSDDQAPDFGNSYSDAYDKSINWTDRIIGRFLYDVDELGLLPNTVVVIGSDHGEAFQEHGFEGHARNLYREVAQVPFIIILPIVLDPGIVVDDVDRQRRRVADHPRPGGAAPDGGGGRRVAAAPDPGSRGGEVGAADRRAAEAHLRGARSAVGQGEEGSRSAGLRDRRTDADVLSGEASRELRALRSDDRSPGADEPGGGAARGARGLSHPGRELPRCRRAAVGSRRRNRRARRDAAPSAEGAGLPHGGMTFPGSGGSGDLEPPRSVPLRGVRPTRGPPGSRPPGRSGAAVADFQNRVEGLYRVHSRRILMRRLVLLLASMLVAGQAGAKTMDWQGTMDLELWGGDRRSPSRAAASPRSTTPAAEAT